MTRVEKLARKLLRRDWEKLTEREKKILSSVDTHSSVARNINRDLEEKRALGEKVADAVAAFGGSWTFILLFGGFLLGWVALNSFFLARADEAFDPYPYILLNLFLSMIAAIQAPIIMMSQNRQAARDRLDAANDYEVNLKSELEIGNLHAKFDELYEQKWIELIAMQQEQIRLLEQLLKENEKLNFWEK